MNPGSTPTAGTLDTPGGPLTIKALPPSEAIRFSIIVPTYNESKNIEEMVRRLASLLDAPFGNSYEIIVVDDDSPDRTWESAQSLASEYPQLRVMRRRNERGLSTAVVRGWQAARGDVLAVIDADLQHPPEITLALYDEIRRGADIAVASRHIEGGGVSDWSLIRRVVSRVAQVIGLVILPGVVGRVSDPMSGYFMMRRTALLGVVLNPLGYKILIEVLGRGRFRWIGEVPYVFRERVLGASKATGKTYLEYLRHLLRLRLSTLPINRFVRFATVGLSGVVVDMGLLFLLSDPSMLGWGLTRSKLIASEMAILNNFAWNDIWTFRDLSARQRSFTQRLRRFGKFQLICLAGVALNTLLLNLQFNLLGMNRYLANAIAIAVVTGWNFWLNLKLSWRVAQPETPQTENTFMSDTPELPIKRSDEEWKKELPPETFSVMRKHGTERPGTSPLNKEHRAGMYACAACGLPLFESSTKFDSGTGWPSFFAPLPKAVDTTTDRSLGMARTEVHCARCGGHLGHVFPDGPEPTGERYCMNGVALRFEPK